ncbi:hypothetical protein CPB83DRAFT_853365 [Crepidotus variabilis]|uniref:Uncharacterized protein n=1 Tax=Crepidotus variabilis TaxID=179855 RepID=A0A9P6EH77_9AGAR|nr:hypothetical protein CPB83DRAFT_853365 [Crepidotus variabilis]
MSDLEYDPTDLLFQQAFTAADPVAALLQLLNDDPVHRSPRDVIYAYVDKVDENPYQAQALTSILLKLRQESPPNVPRFSQGMTILIHDELVGLFYNHSREPEITTYGPKNGHLLNALICGLSLQHDLAKGGDELYMLFEALNAPHDGSEESEVLVVGACIQLLMGGHALLPILLYKEPGGYRATPEEIAAKLRNQRCCVKDPRAIKVLDLAISHAESGMKAENSVEDVWSLLFPQSD